MEYLLGLDVGTSGFKALLLCSDGTVAASDTQEYPLQTPRPGWTQQNPEDWWQACIRAIAQVLKKSGADPASIVGIGFSGQMHGMVALDENMQVVRPAILWNDQRTQAQCEEITALAGGEESLLGYTNNRMLTGYTGGKILWMKEFEPENFARTKLIINPKDYIRLRLTGDAITEVSDASGTGFFNVAQRDWSYELLEKVGLSADLFAPCRESHQVVGQVSEEAARITGLTPGCPVTAGGGDAVIQTTGTGLIRPGVLGVVIGTSGVVAMGLDHCAKNNGDLQLFCGNAPHLWNAVGVTLAAGGSYRWYRDVLCAQQKIEAAEKDMDVYDLLGQEAEAAGPGSQGVLFMPWLSGERCPYPDANARGAFLGLELGHDHGVMTRAVMEGVTFSLKQVADLIAKTGNTKATKVIVSGGGALSPLWRQIMADVFGLPVVTVSGSGEGGAYGAALVAGVGVGVYESIDDALDVLKEETQTLPLPENQAVYQKMYGIYQDVYQALLPIHNRLAEDAK